MDDVVMVERKSVKSSDRRPRQNANWLLAYERIGIHNWFKVAEHRCPPPVVDAGEESSDAHTHAACFFVSLLFSIQAPLNS